MNHNASSDTGCPQFIINASQPTQDRIFDPSAFATFLQQRIKVDGRTGNLGDNINVNNVIAAIKSPDVMAEVVDRLDLDVSYTTQGTFYDKTLYGKSLPVKVVFRDLGNDDTASFHISHHIQWFQSSR